jgi:hypothetical protein
MLSDGEEETKAEVVQEDELENGLPFLDGALAALEAGYATLAVMFLPSS